MIRTRRLTNSINKEDILGKMAQFVAPCKLRIAGQTGKGNAPRISYRKSGTTATTVAESTIRLPISQLLFLRGAKMTHLFRSDARSVHHYPSRHRAHSSRYGCECPPKTVDIAVEEEEQINTGTHPRPFATDNERSWAGIFANRNVAKRKKITKQRLRNQGVTLRSKQSKAVSMT